VGKISGRHFIPELLEAFVSAARRSQLPHRLLLVGPDVLGLSVKNQARRLGFEDRITHIPFIKHAELPALYSAAEMFIFPASDAEGFGLPVLEAMACGTPVISTNRGSIAEFARDAALLVETSTIGEMSEAIERLAKNPAMRDELRRSGLEKSKQMRWRKTAEETMQLLWETATHGPRHAPDL
jgi:glycosyltransferase involved in cell wall biosynthesis